MRVKIISSLLPIFVFVLASCYGPAKPPVDAEITSADVQAHINYLASEQMQGRLTGTKEADDAADYIKKCFTQFGLTPAPGHDYIQNFQFIAEMRLGQANKLSFNSDGKETVTAKEDFMPAAFSGSGKYEAEVVLAGYGISAPKLNYDDYKDAEVKGRFVIAIRNHPDYDKPRSDFEDYASFRYKAKAAKEQGAAGIIFVNGAYPKLNEDALPEFHYDRAQSFTDFPVVYLKQAAADKLLSEDGLSIAAVQDSIRKNSRPFHCKLKSKIKAEISVEPVEKTGKNVIGILNGNDEKTRREYIVIGAHYDHLGMGGEGSLYRGAEKLVHPGADDNASGTAGMLELAQKFAAAKNNKRTIVFMAFAGEELGMLGSAFYVNNSYLPLDSAVTMINLDMIGRLNEEKNLIVYGTGTSSQFKNLVDSVNRSYHFFITKNDEGFGPSDQSSFYGKNIPVLFLFTGTHTDYHRPTDKADRINSSGEASVVKFAGDIASMIANAAQRPDYINVPRKGGEKGGAWKVYVGTVPDFGYQGEGFKISGVNEGSPAKKGGIAAGDIMISFAGNKIANIYDYVYALKNCVPGEVVEVVVRRQDKTITLYVELGVK